MNIRRFALLASMVLALAFAAGADARGRKIKDQYYVCLKFDEGGLAERYGELQNVIYQGRDLKKAKGICALQGMLGYRICDKDGNLVYSPCTELQSDLLREAKWVTDYVRVNHFTYGDAPINPAIEHEAKLVSCDRLCGWVLFRTGFTEGQPESHGLVVSNIFRWAESQGFERIENLDDLQPGDIVGVRPSKDGAYPQHVFIYAGKSSGEDLRYDCGTDKRIQSFQPSAEKMNTSGKFMVAYRPVRK